MKFFLLFFLFLTEFNAFDRCSPEISTKIAIYGGASSVLWTSSCRESAQNLTEPLTYPSYNPECASNAQQDALGPKPINYPTPEIPDDCDRIIWQQLRIVETIQYVVDLDLNFCHHYCPDWKSENEFEIYNDNEEALEGCLKNTSDNERIYYHKDSNNDGNFDNYLKKDQKIPRNSKEKSEYLIEFLKETSRFSSRKKKQYDQNSQGLDSPNFVSFVYNFGLGAFLTPSLDDMACGESAPGLILNISDILSEVDSLDPGDLLFLSVNERISRVFLWTGIIATEGTGIYGVETILSNYLMTRRDKVKGEVEKMMKRNDPIYIIADSSNNGPNYRLFVGDYVKDFAFARRIIGKDGNFIGRGCEGLNEDIRERVENKGYIWGKRKDGCQNGNQGNNSGNNDVNVTVQVFVNGDKKGIAKGIFLGKK